jgi:bacterioferritin-associated ferredoxin/NifU-like protein involved in Fe-S cluster formation
MDARRDDDGGGRGESAASPALPFEGPLANADAVGESGSMDAGPGVRVSLAFDEELRIAAAAFEVRAFDAAREVASALCRAILGATLAQASSLSIPDLARIAGAPERSPAVRTVHFAKSAALLPHLGRAARHGPHLTCICFQVPTERIREAIRARGLTTVDQVKDATKAGSGCGTCRPDLVKLLREAQG